MKKEHAFIRAALDVGARRVASEVQDVAQSRLVQEFGDRANWPLALRREYRGVDYIRLTYRFTRRGVQLIRRSAQQRRARRRAVGAPRHPSGFWWIQLSFQPSIPSTSATPHPRSFVEEFRAVWEAAWPLGGRASPL